MVHTEKIRDFQVMALCIEHATGYVQYSTIWTIIKFYAKFLDQIP